MSTYGLTHLLGRLAELRHRHMRRRYAERIARAAGASKRRAARLASYIP